ncbi:hypothetical protein [Archangium sp.]|uniref:hypothetical protein n=1 Tax=Archangium sp. TaxID=1872627 RepID=UPI002D53789F|nr:hypothetical protein [Archangium sp.]HYO58830.1 hypothetical protein [Archangium sp.]
MNSTKQHLLVSLLFGLGCSSPKLADPHVWRPTSGQGAESIPGPLKNFGPFDSFSDALKAACPLILSKPNASVVHLQERDPELALRVSTEYCAWLYYTPEHKYELSMLTDVPLPGSALHGAASCLLPPNVDDPRYPPSSIKYIFLLHNHPFAGELSEVDINFTVAMANAHELVVEAGSRTISLSVVAFFSNSKDSQNPTCDGFYQYAPATRELLQWINTKGDWQKNKVGTVHWVSQTRFKIIRE